MYKQFNIWINVEFGFCGGTLIALHNPETDFIVAEQNVIATIVTFVAPAVVWLYFYVKY